MLCDACSSLLIGCLGDTLTTGNSEDDTEPFEYRRCQFWEVRLARDKGCRFCSLVCMSDGGRLNGHTSHIFDFDEVCIEIVRKRGAGPSSFDVVIGHPAILRLRMDLFRSGSSNIGIEMASRLPAKIAGSPIDAAAVAQARKWLQHCRSTHSKCEQERSAVRLPVRVIDVGIESTTINPQLKVTGLLLGEYATLSHCWGLSKRLTTTRSNLEQHLTDGFSLECLPATFRDAILFARLLHIRYLWIDALCIVQDDIGDWNRHAVLMHSIFSNAVVSLSALDSPDSNSGFLTARKVNDTMVNICGSEIGVRSRLLPMADAISKSVLETRAWCFQERLLPPAVLHFGKEQLYWECLEAEASESLPEFNFATQPAHLLHQMNIDENDRHRSWHQTWLTLVEKYSGRSITRPGDRLPALRGLAEYIKFAIPRCARGYYTYGVWSEHACAGLLWQRKYSSFETGWKPPAPLHNVSEALPARKSQIRIPGNEDRAPSWSWASINRPIDWIWDSRAVQLTTPLDVVLDMGFARTRSSLSDTIPRWAIGLQGHVTQGTCRVLPHARIDGLATFEVPANPQDQTLCVLDRSDEFVFAKCFAVYMTSFVRETGALRHSRSNEESHEAEQNDSSVSREAYFLVLEEISSTSHNAQTVYRRTGIGSGSMDMIHRLFANERSRSLVVY